MRTYIIQHNVLKFEDLWIPLSGLLVPITSRESSNTI